jgi:tRNA (uracil-5-)-methyltransferase
MQHAYGKLALEEKLGRCNFQISPGAFFQVNTEGAEILYDFVVQQVKEVTSDPQQTLLLDVCCGTGTIGLTCMKEGVVGRVLGVDISEPAIDDAKLNAEKNGWPSEDGGGDSALVTTRFVASRAEQVLATEMNEIRKGSFPIVAVVDPGMFDWCKRIKPSRLSSSFYCYQWLNLHYGFFLSFCHPII